MNFYKHHIGDYDADTAHLSWLEDMAYTRLMRLYYRREQPIPADISQACRLVRATSKQEREAVESVLREFFELESDGWHNKRCDGEIEAAACKGSANRTNGRKGGRPKKKVTQIEPTENPLGFSGFPNGTHDEPTKNLLQTPDTRLQEEDSRRGETPSVPDPKPDDPRKAMFDLGVSLLGQRHRGLIGKAVANLGEQRVAEILGAMAVKPPVDPVTYFAKATQPSERKVAV